MTSLLVTIMYTTNLALKWPCLIDLKFIKIQTKIIMQQTQRNNNKPPAEPTEIKRTTFLFVLVSLLELWFSLALILDI